MTTEAELGTRERSGVILSDGTPIEDLFDFEHRTVQLRAYADPEIFALEQEKIFARSWIVVGHESEIPEPGDYMTRHLANDPIVVARDAAGEVHVMLNVCRHRGMQVCRAEVGNAKQLRCPYHGWIYDMSGALKAVTLEHLVYPDGIDKAAMGLRAARVGVCHGWIFATFDDAAPPLEVAMGPAAAQFGMAYGRTDSGMEVLGPPQKWIIPANWKMAAEQFSGDAYHTAFLHMSGTQLGLMPTAAQYARNHSKVQWAEPAIDFEEICERDGGKLLPVGLNAELYAQWYAKMTPQQREFVENSYGAAGGASWFPTFYCLAQWVPLLDGRLGHLINPRVFNPVAPDQIEIYVWAMAERDAPEDLKERCYLGTIQNFGSAGFFEQDDAEAWVSTQRSMNGYLTRQSANDYRSSRPMFTGDMQEMLKQPGWSDDGIWKFWMRWLDFMTDRPWVS